MKEIGLVGCGAWGTNILRDLLQLQCKVHVADIDEHARIRACADGAADACTDIGALPVCDGYVVAVPIPDLAKICAGLLHHRKPIFSEKTLCLSLEDYNCLKSLGGQDYIFAMHKWHYHPGIDALHTIAQSDIIGEPEELHTTRHTWVNDFHGGDVFWTQAVHDLTIIKHILGYIPDKIKAINVIKREDGLPTSFTAMMGEKPTVIISVSGRHCSKRSGVSLHGNKGCAELHNAYDDHITIRNENGESQILLDLTLPLYSELKEFIEYLHNGPRPRCDLEDAKEVTQAILNLRKMALMND